MMYRSATPPMSKDLNLPYPPPAPFGSGHRKDDSESDLHRHQQQHQPQQQQQMNSGLLRFRSAPSSLFGEVCEDFLPARPSSPGADTMFARFLTPDLRDKPPVGIGQRNSHFSPPHPGAGEEVGPQRCNVGFPSVPQMMYHPQQQQQQQQMPNHSTVDSTYQVVGSMAMENAGQIKNGSGLIRQSSSPAGLFSHLMNEGNGYGMTRGMVGFRNGSDSVGETGSRLRSQISFSSRQSSIMSQISEMESEGMDRSSPEETNGGASRGYLPGFPVTSWEHGSLIQDNNFSGLKRGREGEGKMIAGLNSTESQNGELRSHVSSLAHQFSLPKTSSEMAAIEKFLQFQDAVPCKVRAKRGCATHPRSIAERVRRTRISERMRKLQELVPNMDKQTNTADMLDLAVDYIKDLQRQVKVLNESRANCTCSASRS